MCLIVCSRMLSCAAPWVYWAIPVSIGLPLVCAPGQGTTLRTSFALACSWFVTLESQAVYSGLVRAFLRTLIRFLLFSRQVQCWSCFDPRTPRTEMVTPSRADLHDMQTRLPCPPASCITLTRERSRKLARQDRILATHLHPHPYWLIQEVGRSSSWLVSLIATCKYHTWTRQNHGTSLVQMWYLSSDYGIIHALSLLACFRRTFSSALRDFFCCILSPPIR